MCNSNNVSFPVTNSSVSRNMYSTVNFCQWKRGDIFAYPPWDFSGAKKVHSVSGNYYWNLTMELDQDWMTPVGRGKATTQWQSTCFAAEDAGFSL